MRHSPLTYITVFLFLKLILKGKFLEKIFFNFRNFQNFENLR